MIDTNAIRTAYVADYDVGRSEYLRVKSLCDEIDTLRAQLAAAAELERALRECVDFADRFVDANWRDRMDDLKRKAGVE